MLQLRVQTCVCTLAVCLLVGPPARAGDSWSTPFHGVRHLLRTTSTPMRIHALVVDLCAAGVSARATAPSEHQRTVSSFASLVGAEAAINGDFFSFSTYEPAGLAIGNGKVWGGADNGWRGFIAFGKDQVELDGSGSVVSTPLGWMREAAGGYPWLVVDGKAVTSFSNTHCGDRNPRTAVGLSRDRHTLYMVVVDGRWSASAGMTCAELAKLMDGLGAYDAVNFDGGGSSTMWIKGKGVVNRPSDGGVQRVVANHLAIHAHGSGTPAHCDRTIQELDAQIGAYDAPASSDLDGDGRADACARAAGGWSCSLSSGTAFGAAIAGPGLSDKSGWSSPQYRGTLRVADVDGDGKADLCARGSGGVQCWKSTGAGFAAAIAGPKLDDAGGYHHQRYASTIRMADFNGDGKADLCVRTSSDFRCYPSTGSGFGAAVVGPKLSDASGWDSPSCYGTLRMGDVNGDGKADVCGRCKAGVSCWLSTGNGFGNALAGPTWSDASGWASLRFFGTFRLADVNGDGKADLCARSASDFRCVLSTGTGFLNANPLVGPKLADSVGWGDYDHFSTIRLADVNGDAKADVCARGGAGVLCWPSTGKSFGAAITGPPLSDAGGWSAVRYFGTIRFGDVNGDSKSDLCARSSGGLSCWISDGAGFPQKIAGPVWSNAAGWDDEAYYSTIRIAGPPCVKGAEICDGKDNDCDGAVDEGGVCGDGGPPRSDLGIPVDAGDGGVIAAGDGGGDGGGDAEPWFELGAGGGEVSSGCAFSSAQGAASGPFSALALVLLGLLLRPRRRDL